MLSCTIATLSFASDAPVKAELLYKEASIQEGKPFWVAVRIKIEDGWHIYWKNPGETGFPTSIDWRLPEGVELVTVEWPYPDRFEAASTIGYGYHKEAIVLVQLKSSKGNVPLEATLKWLVCSDSQCLPGEADLKLSIAADWEMLFTDGYAKMAHKNTLLRTEEHDKGVDLFLISHDNLAKAHFFPEESGLIAEAVESKSDRLTLPKLSKGVLVLENKDATRTALDVDFTDLPATEEAPSMALMLLFAFAGGLLLNLMPCVLPVISLKILSFVQLAGKSRALTMAHGASFSLGVLVSFWVLAGLLLVLQASGSAVGWGFQLQEPLFVGILASIMLVVSLSFFGIFEIGMIFASWAGTTAAQHRNGLAGSFLSGVLATAVATPCTGPFLGSAVGFAVTLPPLAALLIFTVLGLGMASPYLLLGAFPALTRFLPKPGAWMITFKEIMGFLMLAAVLWLALVFGMQTGTIALFLLLIAFLSITIACWIIGKFGNPVKSRLSRRIAFVVACLFLGTAAVIMVQAAASEPEALVVSDSDWEPYSVKRLEELRASGTPVFIDFTAAWCLICQTNHLALTTSDVEKKMKERGVVRMKADWTRRDPAITAALQKHGRNSVPLYLFYDKGEHPEVLPQVLTPQAILEQLAKND